VLDLTGGNITKGDGNATFNMTGGELRNVNSMNFPFNQAGGTLAVGDRNATGTSTIAVPAGSPVAYNLSAAASLLVDLATSSVAGPGTSDLLNITGGPTLLAGNLLLHALGPIVPNTTYTILDADGTAPGSLVGTFGNAPSTVTADNGQLFSVNYAGGDGNAVVLTALVPEPSLIGLGTIVMAGALGRRRRR